MCIRSITRHATRSPEDLSTPTGQASNGESQKEVRVWGTRARSPQGKTERGGRQSTRRHKTRRGAAQRRSAGLGARASASLLTGPTGGTLTRAAAKHTLGEGSTRRDEGRPPEQGRRRRSSGAGRRLGCRDGGHSGRRQLVSGGQTLEAGFGVTRGAMGWAGPLAPLPQEAGVQVSRCSCAWRLTRTGRRCGVADACLHQQVSRSPGVQVQGG